MGYLFYLFYYYYVVGYTLDYITEAYVQYTE
jgi:hypothetical protein